MSVLSAWRSRRFVAQKPSNSQSLLVFTLLGEWFALPIAQVQKVIPLEFVYGDPQGRGIGLACYQNQEVVVIDVASCLFASLPSQPLQANFLLIIGQISSDLWGIPIDSPPRILHLPQSAFVPLPDTYLNCGYIKCLSSTLVQTSEYPALFLLDTTQLSARLESLSPRDADHSR